MKTGWTPAPNNRPSWGITRQQATPAAAVARFAGTDTVRFGTQGAPHEVKVARLVLQGAPKPDAARQILLDGLARWPEGTLAKFLVIPGGFAEAPLPKGWQGKGGWGSAGTPRQVAPLVASAEQRLREILTPNVVEAARGKARFITVGVDVVGEAGLRGPHMELVAVFDVEKNRVIRWTGKSFPTRSQETKLVQASLESHLLQAGDERVLVLGCNDLNLFSPRVKHNVRVDSPRGQMSRQMRAITGRFKPTLVLQHPHATDTPNIWRPTWVGIGRLFGSVQGWVSAIRYFNPRGGERKPLDKVLVQTRSDAKQVIDIVLDTGSYESRPSRYLKGLQRF
jgi:hypothetical protein